MRQVHKKCDSSYGHFFVRTNGRTSDPDGHGLWMREIQLECHRCGYVMWIDSVIRVFGKIPEVWKGT